MGKLGNWKIVTMGGCFARRLIPFLVVAILTGGLSLAVPAASYAQTPPTQTDVDGLKDAARSEYASATDLANKAKLWRGLAKAAREEASKALEKKDRKRWEKTAAKREDKAKSLDQESKRLLEAAKKNEAKAAKLQEAVPSSSKTGKKDKVQPEEQDEEVANKAAKEDAAEPKKDGVPDEVTSGGPPEAEGNTASVSLDTGTTTVTIPDNVILTYTAGQETTAGDRQRGDCRPGGARGALECGVSKRLDDSDNEGSTTAEGGARLTIPLTPRLDQIGNEFRLSLVVGEPDLGVSGVSRDTEVQLRREAAMVLGILRHWRHNLSSSQVRSLRQNRTLKTAIVRPFANLKFFSTANPDAAWAWAPFVGPPELRFVIKQDDGAYKEISKIPRGLPFYVEADYRKAPDEDTKKAVISWMRCPAGVDVTVHRTQADQTLYRSEAHVIDAVDPAGPEGGVLSESEGYNWLYGHWDVEYRDLRLGTVKGRANVTPVDDTGGLKSVEIALRHPRTGADYRLSAQTLEEIGNTLVFKFRGRSPPSGAAPGADTDANSETENPIALAVPAAVEKVDAKLENVSTSASVVDVELRLDLKTELSGGATPTESTYGWWRYFAPRDQIKFYRGGDYEALNGDDLGQIRGPETWKRTPLTIESVETVSFNHQKIYDGQPILGMAFIEFRGLNLPVQPRRSVEISFADSNVIYTGNYSANPRDASRLIAEVAIKKGIEEAPKQVTLNGAQGVWNLGLPREAPNVRFVRAVREGEIDVVQEVFFGEIFYIEAAYQDEPLTGAQTFLVGPDGGNQIEVTLNKIPLARNILRSEPIILLDPDTPRPSRSDFNTHGGNTRPSNFPQGVDKIVRAKPGTKLLAARRGEGAQGQNQAKAVARALAPPPRKWADALSKARACYRSNPENFLVSKWVFIGDLLVEPIRSLGRALGSGGRRLENPIRNFNSRYTTQIKPEGLAAAIILRDRLLRLLALYSDKLAASRPPTALELKKIAATGRPHPLYTPLFLQKVKRGRAVSEGTMTPGVEIGLADVFAGSRYFLVTDAQGNEVYNRAAFDRFVDESIAEAWQETVSNAKKSAALANGAQDCDVGKMINLAGWGIEPVVQSVLPTLMRHPTANEPRYPRILPDRTARRWVSSLGVLGAAVRAQDAYGSLDTDALILGMTLWFGAYSGVIPEIAALPTSAVVSSDVAIAGVEWYRWGLALDEARFSEGIIPVVGDKRAKIAQAEADARLFSAALSTAAAGVTGALAVYEKAVAKGIKPSLAAVEQAEMKAARISGRDPQLSSLSAADKKVLQFAEGRALKKQRLGKPLDASDQKALALKNQREVQPPRRPERAQEFTSRMLRDSEIPPGLLREGENAPGNVGIGGPRLGLEVLPASRLGEGATDTTWEIISGTSPLDVRIQSPLGELKVDPTLLNRGGFADVHDLLTLDGEKSGFVIKFYSKQHGNYAIKARAASREGRVPMESYGQANAYWTFRETQLGAGQLSTENISQIELQTWGSIPGHEQTMFVVQRKVGSHLPPGVDKEVFLDDLTRNGARASEGVQNSVLDLLQDMKKNGLGWEDANTGNIVIQFKDDKPVGAAVLDHDRIINFKSTDPGDAPIFFGLKEGMEADPGQYNIRSMPPFKKLDTADEFMAKMLEHKAYIAYTPQDGFFSWLFDMEVVCKHPGFRNIGSYVPKSWATGNACGETVQAAQGMKCSAPGAGVPRMGPTGTLPQVGQPGALPAPPSDIPGTLPLPSSGRLALPPVPLDLPKVLPQAPRQGALPSPVGNALAAGRLPEDTNILRFLTRGDRRAAASCPMQKMGALNGEALRIAA